MRGLRAEARVRAAPVAQGLRELLRMNELELQLRTQLAEETEARLLRTSRVPHSGGVGPSASLAS